MKNEKNYGLLIGIVIIILVLQSGLILFLFYRISELENQLINENNKISNINDKLNMKIDTNNADIQDKINELSKTMLESQFELKKEVGSLSAKTSSDFSNIIETATEAVVNIRTNIAQGTGFIISNNGYVVTNSHVISGARVIEAVMSNQDIKEMDLIGYDTNLDIALLKINGNFHYLELGNSDDVKVGEKVIAIGNPLGLSFSVSEGIISAVHRIGSNDISGYIQTDAALNPGNSGGPLIDTNGKVIGINNFKMQGDNLGFALESNYIKKAVNAIARANLNETLI